MRRGMEEGTTYYGIEHRGHLYLPGCVPHTPQSLGSGFFRGGDGSVSEAEPGSAVGSAARGAVGSGETAPSIVDGGAELPLSATGMEPVLLLLSCSRLIAVVCLANLAPGNSTKSRAALCGMTRCVEGRLPGRSPRSRSVPIRCEIGRFGCFRADSGAVLGQSLLENLTR